MEIIKRNRGILFRTSSMKHEYPDKEKFLQLLDEQLKFRLGKFKKDSRSTVALMMIQHTRIYPGLCRNFFLVKSSSTTTL